MTVGEVKLVTEVYIEEKKTESKVFNTRIYNAAYLTASFVGLILNGKQPPTIENVFPDVEVEPAKTNGVDNEVIKVREQLREFAMNANKRRKNK